MKRFALVLFVLLCCTPTGHAQEPQPPHSIALERTARHLVWSPDSRYIAFLATDEDHDTNVQVIEVSSGELIADFDYAPDEIVWSPDSTRLAVNGAPDAGDDFRIIEVARPITILDINTGGETVLRDDLDVNGLAWSPDGTRMAVTTCRYETSNFFMSMVKVVDVTTGHIEDLTTQSHLKAWIVGAQNFANSYWYAPVWSPDGMRLAVPNLNGTLAIWDVEQRTEIFSAWGFLRSAHSLAWNSSGSKIAAAGPNMIRAWDLLTGKPIMAIPGRASDLRWTHEDRLAIVGRDDISLVDPVSTRITGSLETGLGLDRSANRWDSTIAWSPDGRSVAYPTYREIRIVSPVAAHAPPPPPPIALSLTDSIPPLLSTVPSATEPLAVMNVHQIALLGQFGRDNVRDVMWSPDGRTIALLGTRGVWLYDDPTLTQPPRLLAVASGTISTMLFSPDSRYLALAVENEAARDFAVHLWNLQSDRVEHVMTGHTGAITTLDFSADSRLLATGSADSTIRLWNMETGEPAHVLWDHVDTVLSVDFSPDAGLLVSAGDIAARLWDAETGALLDRYNGDWTEYSKQDPHITNAQFSRDGKTVFYFTVDLRWESASLNQWLLHDVAPSIRAPRWSTPTLSSFEYFGDGRYYEMAFSPDGSTMIPYSTFGSYLTIMLEPNAEDVEKWWALSCIFGSGAVAFSPDGSVLATGILMNSSCDPLPDIIPTTVVLWDPHTADPHTILRGHLTPVDQLLFSPDGNRLLSVGTDDSIRLWDVSTGEELRVLTEFRNPASYLSFDSTGALVSLEMGRNSAVIRNNDISVAGIQGEPRSLTGLLVDHAEPSDDRPVVVTRHHDFYRISTGADAWIWKVETGELLRGNPRKTDRVESVALNPTGALLALSQDGVVRLWDLETQTEQAVLLDAPDLTVQNLAFSPDGQVLAGIVTPPGSAVKLWDLATGAQRSIVLPDPAARITALAFSPDGLFVAAQTQDSNVWILPLRAGVAPVVLRSGAERIRGVAFSSDSALLALATSDGVQVWDRVAGVRLVTLDASSIGVAFNNDDTLLASGESDGTIRLWGIR